jgi:predicted nucleotidyltransferase
LSATSQYAVADQLTTHLREDPRVRAVWLAGSLGRDHGDRHSDIDLHIALLPENIVEFRAGYEAVLNHLRPVLKHHELFGGTMIGTLLSGVQGEIVALQTWLNTESSVQITEGRTRVLFDRDHFLRTVAPQRSSAEEINRALYVEICYFWSLFSTLPAIERHEILSTAQRLYLLMNQMIFVHSLGRGRPRDVGDWRLNELLEDDERVALEGVLRLPDLSEKSIIKAHLQLAQMMQKAGRNACKGWSGEYPETLERAVLGHVSSELNRMGFPVEQRELEPDWVTFEKPLEVNE